MFYIVQNADTDLNIALYHSFNIYYLKYLKDIYRFISIGTIVLFHYYFCHCVVYFKSKILIDPRSFLIIQDFLRYQQVSCSIYEQESTN